MLLLLILLDSPSPRVQSRTYLDCFDTVSTLYDHTGDKDFSAVADRVGEMMREYHSLYDIHNPAAKSNLYTVNRAQGEWVLVDERIIELIEWGVEIYELTNGEVNIAMGSVTALWKSSLVSGALPSADELSAAMAHTDISKIEIDREASAVRLLDVEMSLDVGAIAKGFAEERIAEWLLAEGKVGYALDMGGNLRAVGAKPSGEGFSVGIRNPDTKEGGFVETLSISDGSIATSGGYERYYDIGGARYHHIFDKDTLTSPTGFLSVSVVTKSAALADALSTALFCMTEDEIARFVGEIDEEIKIILVDKDGNVLRF